MSNPEQPFEFTGGFGSGPMGSMPHGSNFTDETLGPARPDILSLSLYYENEALIIQGQPDNLALPLYYENEALIIRAQPDNLNLDLDYEDDPLKIPTDE